MAKKHKRTFYLIGRIAVTDSLSFNFPPNLWNFMTDQTRVTGWLINLHFVSSIYPLDLILFFSNNNIWIAHAYRAINFKYVGRKFAVSVSLNNNDNAVAPSKLVMPISIHWSWLPLPQPGFILFWGCPFLHQGSGSFLAIFIYIWSVIMWSIIGEISNWSQVKPARKQGKTWHNFWPCHPGWKIIHILLQVWIYDLSGLTCRYYPGLHHSSPNQVSTTGAHSYGKRVLLFPPPLAGETGSHQPEKYCCSYAQTWTDPRSATYFLLSIHTVQGRSYR